MNKILEAHRMCALLLHVVTFENVSSGMHATHDLCLMCNRFAESLHAEA